MTKSRFLLPGILWLALTFLYIINAYRFPWFPDDTAISLRYAANLAEGIGPVFNPGEFVEGYTNFLFVILTSLFLLFDFNGETVVRFLSLVFGLAVLPLSFIITKQISVHKSGIAILSPLLLALTPAFFVWGITGMETTMFTALTLGGVLVFNIYLKDKKFEILTGILFALATLTRPDGVIFFAIIVLTSAILLKILPWRMILAYAVPVAAHVAFRYFYYSDWVPNTFHAKVSGLNLETAEKGVQYLLDFFNRYGGVSIYIFLFIAAVVYGKYNRNRYLLAPLAILFLWSYYQVCVGGDYMPFFRFLTPVLPYWLIIAVVLFEAMTVTFNKNRLIIVLSVIMVLVFTVQLYSEGLFLKKEVLYRYNYYRQIGMWFKENTPGDSVIALNAVGWIPYYSERRTVDMLGLNDKHIAKEGFKKIENHPGHQCGDGNYVLSRKPDYIILGNLAPGENIQDEDRAVLNQYVKNFSFIGDQQIWDNPEFHRSYAEKVIVLPDGEKFRFWQKKQK